MAQTDNGKLSNVMVEILLTLGRKALHGYGIKLDIEDRIGEGFILGSSSLYQALQRLERRGLVAAQPSLIESDGRRGRTYRITEAGTERLNAELDRMNRVIADARQYDIGRSERAS